MHREYSRSDKEYGKIAMIQKIKYNRDHQAFIGLCCKFFGNQKAASIKGWSRLLDFGDSKAAAVTAAASLPLA